MVLHDPDHQEADEHHHHETFAPGDEGRTEQQGTEDPGEDERVRDVVADDDQPPHEPAQKKEQPREGGHLPRLGPARAGGCGLASGHPHGPSAALPGRDQCEPDREQEQQWPTDAVGFGEEDEGDRQQHAERTDRGGPRPHDDGASSHLEREPDAAGHGADHESGTLPSAEQTRGEHRRAGDEDGVEDPGENEGERIGDLGELRPDDLDDRHGAGQPEPQRVGDAHLHVLRRRPGHQQRGRRHHHDPEARQREMVRQPAPYVPTSVLVDPAGVGRVDVPQTQCAQQGGRDDDHPRVVPAEQLDHDRRQEGEHQADEPLETTAELLRHRRSLDPGCSPISKTGRAASGVRSLRK